MSGARRRALMLAAVIALMAAAAFALSEIRRVPASLPPRSLSQRPPLLLLTTLPLVFSEDFSLKGGSPALKKLQTRYQVVPISVTDQADLAKGRLLLMAQPQAQTAENLVTLDNWVRHGGRVLVLADPMLEWPSKRPLGDPLRPPPMFADTGLLGHWGLRLDAPDRRGSVVAELGGRRVTAVSPGTLHGTCLITGDAMVAHCRVGQGRATIVADADFLNVDSEASQNLDGVLEELAKLEST